MKLWSWLCFIVAFLSFAMKREKDAIEEKFWIWDDGDQDNRVAINTSDIFFPPDFVWGTATSAHQVEGDCTNNNWYEFEQIPGSIHHGHKSGKACDHWNRYPEDIELMKQLGVNSFRFSIEWSKIEPTEGHYDQAAINHYHQVIDLLLQKGITPWVTLHHFTNPIWFVKKGDFEREENIKHFVDFSVKMFSEYSGKVKHWCTINEPTVYVSMGWFTGMFPPGKKDWLLAGTVLKNLLESHVQIYFKLKALPNGREAKIGIVNNIPQFEPWHSWNPLDIFISGVLDHAFNECVLHFFKTGKFNFRVLHVAVSHVNLNAPKSNDYAGLNYYSHYHVRFSLDSQQPFKFVHIHNSLMTDFAYPIYPEGIYRSIERVSELNLPIYITENGIADHLDDRRHLFIRRYLYAVSRAMRDGFDVKGYFYWSLIDNFEWAEGFDMRFGLYEVDYATQKRTLRDGSRYFMKVIAAFSKKNPPTTTTTSQKEDSPGA